MMHNHCIRGMLQHRRRLALSSEFESAVARWVMVPYAFPRRTVGTRDET